MELVDYWLVLISAIAPEDLVACSVNKVMTICRLLDRFLFFYKMLHLDLKRITILLVKREGELNYVSCRMEKVSLICLSLQHLKTLQLKVS